MACNYILPKLPADIIEFQILSRLPVKSLLRFRSVCKSWKSLISGNPDFIMTQFRNSNNNSIMLRRKRHESKFTTWYAHSQLHSKIIGSINGLVCFFDWRTNTSTDMVSAIWNPATKQYLKIPALVNKTDVTPYCVGFGFDSVVNDYKVLYVTTIKGQPLVGDIYSCNACSWKKIAPSNFLYHGTLLNFNQPAFVNGSIYWLNQQIGGFNKHLTVISYDVRHEVFKLLPDSFEKESDKDVVLMNMRDSVAVIFYNWTLFLGNTVDVHMFNERCGVWKKISIGPFIGKEPTFLLAQKLLACFANGDILFAGPDLKLSCVNPETHTIKSLAKKGNKCNCYNDGCTYTESLIFIEGMKESLRDHEIEIFSLYED